MRILTRIHLQLLSAAALFFILPACTLKGTTEQISDTTQNTTVSTSGRSWFTEDGLVRKGEEVNAFTAFNFDNLKQDMALGHGEYLTSLGTLLGIPQEHRANFFALAQGQYPALVRAGEATPTEFLLALDRTLVDHAIPTDTSAKK